MEAEHNSNTLRDLTDAQRIAIRVLVMGGTDREAAEAAGKTRETVNKWRHRHPEFRADLNRERKQLQDHHVDRCRTINGLWLDFVQQGMMDDDIEAFKMWGRTGALSKINTAATDHLDSEDIIAEQVNRRAQQIEAEGEEPEHTPLSRVLNGGRCPESVRTVVERDLRAVTDCVPVPEDSGPVQFVFPMDDLEDEEPTGT